MAKALSLPRSRPEEEGVSSRAILSFLKAAQLKVNSLHAFMLVRHGKVVAQAAWQPFDIEGPHSLFSLSKSFASTAIGMAVAEGLLSVEDNLLSFFPQKLPSPIPPNLAAMKVRHLLSMNTGHAEDTTDKIMRSADPAAAFLALPVQFEPGSHFVYNSGATFMLSAIIQALTGKRLSEYLKPRLFDKLGIVGARWDRHTCGIDFGGWGLNIKLEDAAKLGLLYLHKGSWEGEQLLPASWVEAASSKQSENADPANPDYQSDWQHGYGYQFWRCKTGVYRGDGAFGQQCIILPEHDAVVAIFAGLPDMQAELDLVWKYLLPGLSDKALAPEEEAQKELLDFAESLSLPCPAPASGSAGIAMGGGSFTFDDNWAGLQSIRLDFGKDEAVFRYRFGKIKNQGNGLTGPLNYKVPLGSRSIHVGYGRWIDGSSWLSGTGKKKASASGAWTAPDSFLIRVFERETPYIFDLLCGFEEGKLKLSVSRNVAMGPVEFPPILSR